MKLNPLLSFFTNWNRGLNRQRLCLQVFRDAQHETHLATHISQISLRTIACSSRRIWAPILSQSTRGCAHLQRRSLSGWQTLPATPRKRAVRAEHLARERPVSSSRRPVVPPSRSSTRWIACRLWARKQNLTLSSLCLQPLARAPLLPAIGPFSQTHNLTTRTIQFSESEANSAKSCALICSFQDAPRPAERLLTTSARPGRPLRSTAAICLPRPLHERFRFPCCPCSPFSCFPRAASFGSAAETWAAAASRT